MKSWFKKLIISLVIFAVFFGAFYYIQFSFSSLEGYDAYYHMKQAHLISTQGVEECVESFPWLQKTVIEAHPADQWFGFHLLLIPFTLLGLNFGGKLASIVLASLLFLVLFWVLKKLRVKFAFFWTLIAFFSTYAFTWRLLMTRPHLLSIPLSFLGIYFIIHKRYYLLFFLSLIFSFSVVESPFIIILSLLWMGIEKLKGEGLDWKLISASFSGFALGLLIRPDFPNNLYLLYQGSINLMILRIKGVSLNFGAEFARPFMEGVKNNIFLFLTTALPISYLIVQTLNKKLREISKWYWYFFILTWGFTGVSLFKSQRFVEYWAPFAVIFSALTFTRILLPNLSKLKKVVEDRNNYNPPFRKDWQLSLYQKLYRGIRKGIKFSRKRSVKITLIGTIILGFVYFGFAQVFALSGNVSTPSHKYESAANWLKRNSSPESVVLNQPWSSFPVLFFYNHQNYYGWGIDPSFMYHRDKELYWYWRNLADKGVVCSKEKCEKEVKDPQQVFEVLNQQLEADYLLINKAHSCDKKKYEDMEGTLSKTDKIKEVFYEKGIKIYRVGGSSLQD